MKNTKSSGKKQTPLLKKKINIDMKKFSAGTLHSGPGKKHIVTNKKQALAIAYSQARKGKK